MTERLPQYFTRGATAFAVLRYHVAIYLVTCLMAVTIGSTLLGSFLSVSLLNLDISSFRFFWSTKGLCGDFNSFRDISIIFCRLFYSREEVYLTYLPFLFVFVFVWILQCIHSRRLIFKATQRQRLYLVLAMYIVSLGHVGLGIALLPEYILFTGPLNGFHPVMPLILSLSQLFTPLIFWFLVSKFEIRCPVTSGED